MEAKKLDASQEKFSGKVAFGFAMTRASSILSSLLIGEVTYFATNSLGIAAAAIAGGMAFKTAMDAITDLFFGSIIDRTHTKWGKARPYTLSGILVWICILGIFCIPTGVFGGIGNLNQTAVVVYITVLATLASAVFETMRGVAYDTHLKRSIVNDDNRVKVMTVGGVVFSIGSMGMQVVLPIIIEAFNGTQQGFILTALVMSVLGITASIVAFLFCKEYSDEELAMYGGYDANEATEKVPVKEFLKSLGKNKYIIQWTVINFLIMLIINGSFVTGQYYFEYVFGDLGSLSLVVACSAIAFPVMFFIPKLVRSFGVVNCIRFTLVIAIFGICLRMIFPQSLVVQCIGYLCASLPQVPIAFVGSQVTIECMEYGRYKTGHIVEAMYSSFVNFAQKISSSVNSLILGIVLSATGFDLLTKALKEGGFSSWADLSALGTEGYETYVSGGAETVNHAMNGISTMYNIVPLVAMIIIFVMMLFFNLEKDLEVLRREHGTETEK